MAEKKHFNRREFLKIVGAGSGLAAAGCSRDLPEKLIPYVVQPDEVVPGVAQWYAGTCMECGSGCGTLARVREGRVVKLEGNPLHPVNQGGLCAVGQSALQTVYDPDRIREPLARDAGGPFAPVAWKAALEQLATAVSDASKNNQEIILLTKTTGASEEALIREAATRIPGLRHLTYDLLGTDAEDIATEAVFGAGARMSHDFAAADVIVSFGADYHETYRSPMKAARGWAKNRKPNESGQISKVYHFEPRLSLTAANADRWIMNAPGSEERVLRALLKIVQNKGSGSTLSAGARSRVGGVLGTSTVDSLLVGTNVAKDQLERIADELIRAGKKSLVIAGGTSVSGPGAVQCAIIAHLVNAIVGSIGTTVLLHRVEGAPPARDRYQELVGLLAEIADKKRKVPVFISVNVNLIHLFPAAARAREALSQVGLVGSFATNLDETASFSNVVFPLSTAVETWLDSEPEPGVFALNQPAMQPLYQTQSFGDTLIALLAHPKINKPLDKITSFHDFIRSAWRARTGDAGFEDRWLGYVETGGDFANPTPPLTGFQVDATRLADKPVTKPLIPGSGDVLPLLTFATVNSFDGSVANRAWLQELPNPITTTVWGIWLEMHPETALRLKIKAEDVVRVVAENGSFEAPVYITPYIHPSVVAAPLGQGHVSMGRYANGVGANTRALLPVDVAGGLTPFSAAAVHVQRATSHDYLVKLQFSDTQLNRGIARNVKLSRLANAADGHAHGGAGDHHGNGHVASHEGGAAHGGGHGGGHHDPLALGPRPEPPQMYRQMEHPLYRWGMTIDLASCTGCSACVVACYAENNVPVVGKTICNEGREMSWLRIERYLDGPPTQPVVAFVPMLCQHCNNAPCEPVCPVYATYHTDDGLNAMVYNRCVGTRYCLNNCSYKVRRFNWHKYAFPEPLTWQLNPDVTVREVGVMEKCTFCIQRIREAQFNAKDQGRPVRDGEIDPACASSCPTRAITFGDLKDQTSRVAKEMRDGRVYKVLDAELNTQPAVGYLARVIQG